MATPNTNQPLNEEVLIDSLRGNTPGQFISTFSIENDNSDPQPQEHQEYIEQNQTLNYDIGSQTGDGGGSVTINDTFNWTGSEVLSTQNKLSGGLPTNRSDTITISNSTGFNRQYGMFNISSVTAEKDMRLIENLDNTGRTPRNSNPSDQEYYEMAMSFNITEDFVNLSKVRIILGQNLFGNPQGKLYIVNSTSGGAPNDTQILTEKLDLLVTVVNWDNYSFSNPILLTKGTYFVVMNATVVDSDNYWHWYWQHDLNDDASEDGIAYYKDFDHGSWTEWTDITLPLQIEVLPVENNGTDYVEKTYRSPQELEFCYNTTETDTELSSFSWFIWHDTSTHNFQTNTSVTYDLDFIANYTYSSNPINGVTFYVTQNNTDTFWNVTFSIKDVNNTYNVNNRTISISGLQSDWNGWEIYWNDSSSPKYSDLDGDSDINYSNGSSTMIVNMSATWQNQTWNLSFNAPNYLYNFNLSRGGSYLTYPNKANITDIVMLNFEVEEIGGNSSFWIEYDGSLINDSINFNAGDLSFSETWDINESVSQTTNVNGTYDLQAFWISSDKTKVGTVIRALDAFINTSLDVQTDLEVVIGQQVNVTALYKSIHNDSHVQNALIDCYVNWTTDETMDQMTGTDYNASFPTQGQG
ncbi:MAG: hypothetical protein ACW964_11970, partial [Candidatus Hodarchaeales archaeon]